MTKEEFEKEAGNWLRKYLLCCKCEKKCNCIDSNSYCEEQVLKAYVDSAEPREKRIEELEKKIKQLQDDIDCLTLACENYREEMEKNLADATELEKENAELKERNRGLLESCEGATMMYKDLCKAKEIIKYLLSFIQKENYKTRWDIKIEEAEQFISEISE